MINHHHTSLCVSPTVDLGDSHKKPFLHDMKRFNPLSVPNGKTKRGWWEMYDRNIHASSRLGPLSSSPPAPGQLAP